MAWTDASIYRVNQMGNQDVFSILKDNLVHLHKPPSATYRHPGTGGNYTVTGELGQDVGSPNFKLSVTTTAQFSLVLASFYGQFKVTGGTIRFNIVKTDNLSQLGVNLFASYGFEVGSVDAEGESRGYIWPFVVPAGTHEFRAIWGISPSASTGTLIVANRPQMSVWVHK